MSILHEQCTFPKATDLTFFDLLKQNTANDPNINIQKQSKHKFTVHHFAGDVEYTVLGFLRFLPPDDFI